MTLVADRLSKDDERETMGLSSHIQDVASTEVEDVSVRFASHLHRLQEFFSSRGLRLGSPADVFPLTERLSNSGTFHEEMSSIVRAIIFSEGEQISQADLLGLITAAIAGPHFDETAPEMNRPVRQLLAFVGWVIRSLWKKFGDEHLLSEELVVERPASAVAGATLPVAELAPEPADATSIAGDPRPENTRVRAAEGEHMRFHRQTRPEPTPVVSSNGSARLRGLQRERAPLDADVPTYPQYRSLDLISTGHRLLWFVGLAGIFLGLALGFWLRDRPPLPNVALRNDTSPLSAAPTSLVRRDGSDPLYGDSAAERMSPAPPPPAIRKPSPYGEALDEKLLPNEARTPSRLSSEDAGPRAMPATAPIHPRFPGAQQTSGVEVAPRPQPATPYVEAADAALTERAVGTSLEPEPSRVPEHTSAESYLTSRPQELSRLQPDSHHSVFLSASGVMAANLLAAPAPVYPQSASAAGVQGKVVVQAFVGPDGGVVATRILSGPAPLREAALNAVRRWHYRPYFVDGRATGVATNATLDFRLYP